MRFFSSPSSCGTPAAASCAPRTCRCARAARLRRVSCHGRLRVRSPSMGDPMGRRLWECERVPERAFAGSERRTFCRSRSACPHKRSPMLAPRVAGHVAWSTALHVASAPVRRPPPGPPIDGALEASCLRRASRDPPRLAFDGLICSARPQGAVPASATCGALDSETSGSQADP